MATYLGNNLTFSTSTGVAHSAAQVAAWVDEIIAACTSVGLVQTADTGQLTPGALPAYTVSDWGYLVFRFDDALQATNPIFIKFRIGRGNNAGVIRVSYTIGTSTDGAGTITGTATAEANMTITSALSNNYSNMYTSFSEGAFFFGHLFNASGGETFQSWLQIERNRDATYLLDGTGFTALCGGDGNSYCVSVRTVATAQVWTWSRSFVVIPSLPASTALLNGTKQLYPHFYNHPEIRQRWSTFTLRQSDFGTLPMKFVAAPFAGQSRQFITFGTGISSAGSVHCNSANNQSFTLAVLWED